MKIGFFLVDPPNDLQNDGALYARVLVRSAKKRMPGTPIVQFTDMTSKPVKGVDEVRRKPSEPMALLRMRHQSGVEGEWLFVDTDVVIQRSVHKVFEDQGFDVAVTSRNWSHLREAVGFAGRMPFNTGVMFSRRPSFFAEAYGRLRELTPDLQQWMGDQEVICDMVQGEDCRYQVKRLKGSRFNFPPYIAPKAEVETQAEAYIVHYKGPHRKPMLMKRVRQELGRCA